MDRQPEDLELEDDQLEGGDGPSEKQFEPSRVPSSSRLRNFIAEQIARICAFEIDSKRRLRRRRAADQQRFESAVTAILCDLIHAELSEPGSWRYATFSKAVLGRASRGPHFISETFPDIVRCMSDPAIALLEYELGSYSPFGGRCTTIRAGQLLQSCIGDLGLDYRDLGCDLGLLGDSIRLRAPKTGKQKQGELLPVPPGEPADTFRREVDQLNRWYAQADLSCSVLPDGRSCDLSSRYLRRHFNNGRMDQGGRFFGAFWVDMKAKYRLECLMIDGEPVVSLDFSQCAIRIAYGHAGVPVPDGDLYEVGDLHRAGVKKVMNALLHSSKELSRFPRETRPDFGDGFRFDQVLRFIASRHSPIKHLFGTGFGMQGFFIESQVIVKSLLELMSKGVTALPVHDCILVSRSAAPTAKEVMLRNFRVMTGAEGRVDTDQHRPISTALPQ